MQGDEAETRLVEDLADAGGGSDDGPHRKEERAGRISVPGYPMSEKGEEK